VRILGAALSYFAIVFGAGFLLGPIRVFVLEPRLGETLATLCETPVLLVVIFHAARSLPRRFGVSTIGARAAMGFGALLLQQAADFALGSVLRGLPPAEQLAHFATPAGLIYAALVIAFAAMPVVANWNRP
jgi:hypothetical protein